MEQVGARARHRAPTLYQPGETYFWGGMLLVVTFGMCLAAIQQAWASHLTGWLWFFAVATAVDVGLYFWCVHSWLTWIHQTVD